MSDYNIQIANSSGQIVIDGIHQNMQAMIGGRGSSDSLVVGSTLFHWTAVGMYGSAIINLPRPAHTDSPPILLIRTVPTTFVNQRWFLYQGARVTGPGPIDAISLRWHCGYQEPFYFDYIIASRETNVSADYGLALYGPAGELLYHSSLAEVIHLDSKPFNMYRYHAYSTTFSHAAPSLGSAPYFVAGTGAHVDGWAANAGHIDTYTVLLSSQSPTSIKALWSFVNWASGDEPHPATSAGYFQFGPPGTTSYVPAFVTVCEVAAE